MPNLMFMYLSDEHIEELSKHWAMNYMETI